jgi:hypothetical protein
MDFGAELAKIEAAFGQALARPENERLAARTQLKAAIAAIAAQQNHAA